MRWLSVLVALGVISCGAPRGPGGVPPRPPRRCSRATLQADVYAARGVPSSAPVPIVAMDDAAFDVALARHGRADVPPPAVLAFHDPGLGRIVVRRRAARAREADWLLAHELGHALQDDHLPPLPRATAPFVQRALREGDATLTQVLYRARCRGNDPRRAVARALAAVRRGDLERAAGAQLEGMTPDARRRLLAPYRVGFEVIAEAYLRGGLDAVEDAFRRPPRALAPR